MGAFISFPPQINSKRHRAESSEAYASESYLMCKSLPYYIHLLNKSTCILLSVKCMLGLLRFLHSPNSDIDYRIFNVRA